MKLREKTTATLLIAIFMISTFAVVVSASAQKGWGKPEVRVRATGHFTSVLAATEGHECFVNIQARQVADDWRGRGVFWDKDYEDGKLVAIITVDSATESDIYPLPSQIILHGTIKVSVDDEYLGSYRFNSVIMPSIQYVTFEIPDLGYLAYVYGDFSNVKLTIDVL